MNTLYSARNPNGIKVRQKKEINRTNIHRQANKTQSTLHLNKLITKRHVSSKPLLWKDTRTEKN